MPELFNYSQNPKTEIQTGRPFNLWIYLFIVIVLSWPFQFWFIFKSTTQFDKYLYSSLAMIMVTVATIIASKFVFRDSFKNAGWSLGKVKYYLYVILFSLFIWFVPALIELATGVIKVPEGVMTFNILFAFLIRFTATLIPAFGEEFGWRAYMLPHLSKKFGAYKGLLLHSFIWWFWHLPVLVGMGIKSTAQDGNELMSVLVLLLISIIPSMLHAVIFAYIWAKTNSVIIATVYHAAYDEVRDTIEHNIGYGPLVELWQGATLIIVGGILLWKVNWKELLFKYTSVRTTLNKSKFTFVY